MTKPREKDEGILDIFKFAGRKTPPGGGLKTGQPPGMDMTGTGTPKTGAISGRIATGNQPVGGGRTGGPPSMSSVFQADPANKQGPQDVGTTAGPGKEPDLFSGTSEGEQDRQKKLKQLDALYPPQVKQLRRRLGLSQQEGGSKLTNGDEMARKAVAKEERRQLGLSQVEGRCIGLTNIFLVKEAICPICKQDGAYVGFNNNHVECSNHDCKNYSKAWDDSSDSKSPMMNRSKTTAQPLGHDDDKITNVHNSIYQKNAILNKPQRSSQGTNAATTNPQTTGAIANAHSAPKAGAYGSSGFGLTPGGTTRNKPVTSSQPVQGKHASSGQTSTSLSTLGDDDDFDESECPNCGYTGSGHFPEECPICSGPVYDN